MIAFVIFYAYDSFVQNCWKHLCAFSKTKRKKNQRSTISSTIFSLLRKKNVLPSFRISSFGVFVFFFFCSCCDVVVLFGLRTDPKENDRKEKNTTKKSNIYKVPQLRKTVREMQFKTKRGKHFSRNGLSSHA